MTTRRCARWAVCALAVVALGTGCSDGPATGEVTGTVRVNGQPPPAGSSITFFPADGKSPSAGATLEDGKYTVQVPVGLAKVEIRVPRSVQKAAKVEGPGSEGGLIEESLPARFNDQTELTFEVRSGKNPKDWDLTVP